MGNSTMIDILGSAVIGGMLLLIALGMNDQATKNTFQTQESLTVQQNMVYLTQIIETDFRKIGYCSNPLNPMNWNQGQYIQAGTGANSISFLSDFDNSGNYSTVTWSLGQPIKTVMDGNNPITMYELDRSVTDPTGVTRTSQFTNLGVTQFSLQYWDAQGNSLPPPLTGQNPTQEIQLTVAMVPTEAYDTSYSASICIWRQKRLVSMNLKRGR